MTALATHVTGLPVIPQSSSGIASLERVSLPPSHSCLARRAKR
jgi:hypothetical protein